MKKLINHITGTEMYVPDDRVDYYVGLGHSLAPATTDKTDHEAKQPAPEKRTRKK
jgi:hypothetical protein